MNAKLMETPAGGVWVTVNKNSKTDCYNVILKLETNIKNRTEILKMVQQLMRNQ